MQNEIRSNIRTFIMEEILEDAEEAGLPEDIPLLSGVLDSFGLMSLLSHLEDSYDLVITNDQVVSKNFESITALAAFVDSKLTEGHGEVAAAS